MADSINRDIQVTQPYYPTVTGPNDETIETLFDKPVYNWQAIRARGLNILNDNLLTGNTTTAGYTNSNDQEGTQPSDYPIGVDPNDTSTVAPAQTSTKLLWDFTYRIISIRGNEYLPTGTTEGLPFNDIYNFNVQELYVTLQNSPSNISNVDFSNTQLNCALTIRGQINMIECGTAGSQFPFLDAGYIETGIIQIQPNFNKWNQFNQFTLISNISTSTGAGSFTSPNLNSLPFLYTGDASCANYVNYVPTGGTENGIFEIALAYRKPNDVGNVWTPTSYVSLDADINLTMICQNQLPPN